MQHSLFPINVLTGMCTYLCTGTFLQHYLLWQNTENLDVHRRWFTHTKEQKEWNGSVCITME